MDTSQVLKDLGLRAYQQAYDKLSAVGTSWEALSERDRQMTLQEQCMNMALRGTVGVGDLGDLLAYAQDAAKTP